MTLKVSLDDLNIAIAWLESNEGEEGGERQSCERVAEFLRAELSKREREQAVRHLVKETGRSATDVRKAMKARGL